MASDPSVPQGNAPGHPGISPTWSSSSKDGVGCAYATSSRVWFTLAQGIVTEIYYPTIDRPQVRDAQFLITDGATFFHEEKRDLDGQVERIEAESLGYHIISDDPKGRYRLVKEVISDPHSACVLVHARLLPAKGWEGKLRLFFLLAPHLEVGGWNNSATKVELSGRTILVASKNSTFLALDASSGFTRSSCGFVGFSDGWQDLNDNYKLDWEYDRAENGNVAVIGEIDLSQGNEFTVAIAFGDSLHAATAVLKQSQTVPFSQQKTKFIDQWQRACDSFEKLAASSGDGGHLYRTSRIVLLSHEDKTFAGAFIASATIPWGNVMGDDDLGGYHLVWVRDMVNTATGLLASGDLITPLRALVYLACSQQADGGFPQNFWINGTPYWKGIQLDEVAFPIMLAWRLWKADALQLFDPYPMVRNAVRYLIEHGPITQQERWEECSGYSPSTIAASIAALICAADFARSRGEAALATFIAEHADFVESHVERWTVTTQGTLVPGISRHYIRILPLDIHDHVPLEDPNTGSIILANRPPGEQYQFAAKNIVDAGFLELVRYGIRAAGSALMEDSLRVIDAMLKVETPFGPAWRRYNHDGYGPHADGKAYQGWGIGRAWPLLAGERAHYELAAGRDARPLVAAMENFATRSGMLPEQVWDQPDLPEARMYLGKPAGSAMPLMWAHAEYIKLLRSLRDGGIFDLIPVVADRYLKSRGRHDLEIWKITRQVRSITAGFTLRVVQPGSFRLRWSGADGQFREAESVASGLGLGYLDLKTQPGQTAPLRFAFSASAADVPQDAVFEVQVTATQPPL
ncbi:MAG TPA: glycoside hydrolase family 15 protein [Candidatus Angelobacter sp.]|nr:glycoside hydrolase family 15 protein [Candidatus Angelobacter sp.]